MDLGLSGYLPGPPTQPSIGICAGPLFVGECGRGRGWGVGSKNKQHLGIGQFRAAGPDFEDFEVDSVQEIGNLVYFKGWFRRWRRQLAILGPERSDTYIVAQCLQKWHLRWLLGFGDSAMMLEFCDGMS